MAGGDRDAGARLLRRTEARIRTTRRNYNWLAFYYTLGVIALAAIWFAVCRMLHPDRVAHAAAHATEHHGVPPLDENLDFTPA